MLRQGLLHTFRRHRTLATHRVKALPIVILMPHSACNCRCVMCDIWKGNSDKKQLSESDVRILLESLRQLGTQRVLMSGGEALLNPLFFNYCRLLRDEGISITLLSTGLTISRNSEQISKLVNEVIVSLDGNEQVHDEIRQVKGAFAKLSDGVKALKAIDPGYRVSARCVIHRYNYHVWPQIVKAAKTVGLDSVSFLPADVTSEAFNRGQGWDAQRQGSVLIPADDLGKLSEALDKLLDQCAQEIRSGFILESPGKLRNIARYYRAHYGLEPFPPKKCNAPWVSAVVEPDGSVRPCFFHDKSGNIRDSSLPDILNSPAQISYRTSLNVNKNTTCQKCVCSLYLPASSCVR